MTTPKTIKRAPGFDLFFGLVRYFGVRYYAQGVLRKDPDEKVSVQAGCGYVSVDEFDEMIAELVKLREEIRS